MTGTYRELTALAQREIDMAAGHKVVLQYTPTKVNGERVWSKPADAYVMGAFL